MTEIYLVRHAHSVYTPEELRRPLSEKGYNQAKKLLDLFKDIKIEVMMSSPYLRALETIEPLRFKYGLEFIIEDAFKERKVAKTPLDDFEAGMKKLWLQPSFHFEGGLSNVQAQNSGVKALSTVLSNFVDKSIVIGTHGNIMALMMQHYDNEYDYEFWKRLSMPAVYKLSFEGQSYMKSEAIKP